MPVLHRQFLDGEIPVFFCLFVSKITVAMGFPAQGVSKTSRYSPENSPAIFIRGGEPWLMTYCWRTQKCRNVCIPHAFFEGKKAWETCARKSTSRTLKEIRQQYP